MALRLEPQSRMTPRRLHDLRPRRLLAFLALFVDTLECSVALFVSSVNATWMTVERWEKYRMTARENTWSRARLVLDFLSSSNEIYEFACDDP